jgi:hypothetical protein
MNSEGKYGYIDKYGKTVIGFEFDFAWEFKHERAIVSIDHKCGVIDKSGKYIISPQFEEIYSDGNIFLINTFGKYGWCDENGKIIINPQFIDAKPFNGNNMAPVLSGESWGFIDKNGNMVINPQFDSAYPFNGKIACINKNRKYGFIDNKGVYVVNPQYKLVSNEYISYLSNFGWGTFEKIKCSEIESDYLNIDAIINQIKKDFKGISVLGIDFNTPVTNIFSKFNYIVSENAKYDSIQRLIFNKNITDGADYTFDMIGNSWLNTSNGFEFNPNFKPSAFVYEISLDGVGRGKENYIFDPICQIFSDLGFGIAVNKEFEDKEVLMNSEGTFLVTITKEYGIKILIENRN